MKVLDNFKADFENTIHLSKGLIKDIRSKAFEKFISEKFPTRRDEYWKYSDPSSILKLDLNYNDAGNFEDDNYDIILSNGKIVKTLSKFKTGNIADGLENGDIPKEIFKEEKNPFLNLNNAFAINGCYLILDSEVKADIKILNLINNNGENHAVYPKLIIIAEQNSDSTIFEEVRIRGNGTNFVNSVMDIIIEDGANLEHIILDDFAKDTYNISNICVKQKKDSNFRSHNFSIGKKLARRDYNIELLGTGANCDLYGLYFVDGDNHIDHHTTIEHKKEHCTSNEHYKGILSGKAVGVFNGRIHVHPQAQKTDAIQNNQNLLLTDDAIIHTKPELEIYADDVKCTHGATIGQLDEKALFYLRTRGLNQKSAQQLLMRAYVGEIIDYISNENIRSEMMDIVLNRLPKGD
ncbi:MAG: Fe-S cluster assembly protein SufD [Candidatus Poseidoniia archaeon]|nr:Fe-S cluster assembly protein SufD [Candidatus Poseidoniia archaeon]|tara:strand:+ start:1180 stop:2400 length:1221 start_codon:yes stop_codon:yes gene_type:complete